MADRPILFSGPMVRALHAGTKTQTRRVLKPQPETVPGRVNGPHQDSEAGQWGMVHTAWRYSETLGNYEPDREELVPFRLHAVGDRLWVREAWRVSDVWDANKPSDLPKMAVFYEATKEPLPDARLPGRLRPGMFMPRWASRLTLTVTDVRVERLQSISEEDALAEGAFVGKGSGRVADNLMAMNLGLWHATARGWYADLWDRINGEGAWQSDPFVVAYAFSVALGNIDALAKEAA